MCSWLYMLVYPSCSWLVLCNFMLAFTAFPAFHTFSAITLLLSLLDTLDIWQKRRANNKIIGRDGLLSVNWLVAGAIDSAVVVVVIRRKHNEVKNMMGCPCKAFPCIDDVLTLYVCVCLCFFSFFFFLPSASACVVVFAFYYLLWFTVERLIWFSSGSHAKKTPKPNEINSGGQLNVSNLFALAESNPNPNSIPRRTPESPVSPEWETGARPRLS